MNYILLSILLSLLVIGYIQFKRAKEQVNEVGYDRPDFDKWDDLPPAPKYLGKHGYFKAGKRQRDLIQKRREQYDAIHNWTQQQVYKEIHR